MQYIEGGVTAPKGFEAASVAAGIKKNGSPDMALICSTVPCRAAGTYTSNIVKAAPVVYDRMITQSEQSVRAVVVNSGVANACTGDEGMRICAETASCAAEALYAAKEEILVASTGVIGVQIPLDKLKAGIALLAQGKKDSREAAADAAKAIMTTDTLPKEVAVSFEVGGKQACIAGMCKGSGMIHPNMCTMLSFVTTDVCISKELLQKALSADIIDTYNMVSVDGDMSTNDTVLLLANGEAGNAEITEENEDFKAFCEALHMVNETLAKKIAGDGEGATALFAVTVSGADTKENARSFARSVVSSNLVKTAVAGHDANWGRIICALGYPGISFDTQKVDLDFVSAAGEIAIARDGIALPFDEEKATAILSESEVSAVLDLHMGCETATAWGCDLTHGYISINADYRS